MGCTVPAPICPRAQLRTLRPAIRPGLASRGLHVAAAARANTAPADDLLAVVAIGGFRRYPLVGVAARGLGCWP